VRQSSSEAGRGGRRVASPTLALWSRTGAVAAWYDPLEVWKAWCEDVRGAAVDAGHFSPEETARHLLGFL
jgi:haloacetate dehalogenase